MKTTRSSFFLLVLAGESIFFLPFVLVRVFRPSVLELFELSNLELGQCFTFYGLLAVPSYMLGGYLADKYLSKNLLSLSLVFTAFGGLMVYFFPNKELLFWVYGFWGISTILLFWAALHKYLRLSFSNAQQGTGFGGLEAGRGALSASLAFLSLAWFVQSANYLDLVLGSSIWLICLAIFVRIALPILKEEKKQNNNSKSILNSSSMPLARILPLAGIIFCAYSGYKITDNLSLYVYDVFQYSKSESALVGSIALVLRPIMALAAGLLFDRLAGINMACFAFLSMGIGGFLLASGWANTWIILAAFSMFMALIGIYGLRGIYFALMKEAAIPRHATGIAVGSLSIIGYLPDIYMSPLMGYLLDSFSGKVGHQMVFGLLVVLSLLGMALCSIIKQKSKT